MADVWRGIFPVLLTPFNEDRSLDEESLQRQVDFVIQAGAHGMVTPVNTSEFYLLSDQERCRLVQIVVDQTAGHVPVIVGTAASNAGTAEALTRHAREVGASGVIAMPPYVVSVDQDGVLDYYSRIDRAAGGLPVVLQNVGGEIGAPMKPEAILRIAEQLPGVRYVKEETLPSTHRIADLLRIAGGRLSGVFGGSKGVYLVDELRRGACGLMSGCHLVDAQVRVYDLLRAGDEEGARASQVRQLPVQNLWSLLGLGVAKEVLRRRGIFRTALCRRPTAPMDAADHAELDYALSVVRPDLTAGT